MHCMLLITYIKSYLIRIIFSRHNFSLLCSPLISLLFLKRLTILFNSHNFFSRSQLISLLLWLTSTYLSAFIETIYFRDILLNLILIHVSFIFPPLSEPKYYFFRTTIFKTHFLPSSNITISNNYLLLVTNHDF